MNESSPQDREEFQRELEVLRALIRENIAHLGEEPFLGKQLDFWMESADFLKTEMKLWQEVGNSYKYGQTIERMRKVLEILQGLIEQLNDGSGDRDT